MVRRAALGCSPARQGAGGRRPRRRCGQAQDCGMSALPDAVTTVRDASLGTEAQPLAGAPRSAAVPHGELRRPRHAQKLVYAMHIIVTVCLLQHLGSHMSRQAQ